MFPYIINFSSLLSFITNSSEKHKSCAKLDNFNILYPCDMIQVSISCSSTFNKIHSCLFIAHLAVVDDQRELLSGIIFIYYHKSVNILIFKVASQIEKFQVIHRPGNVPTFLKINYRHYLSNQNEQSKEYFA